MNRRCLALIFTLLVHTSAHAYLVLEPWNRQFALLYADNGRLVFQPCGERAPDETEPLPPALAQCLESLRQTATPLSWTKPFSTDLESYFGSLFAHYNIPTAALNELPSRTLTELALSSELSEGVNGNAQKLLRQLSPLHEHVVVPLRQPNRGYKTPDDYAKYLISALTATFSDGQISVKLGNLVLPKDIDESCYPGWTAASVLTLMAEGVNGITQRESFEIWLRSRFDGVTKNTPMRVLSWQYWFEPKKTSLGETAYLRHDDLYSLTLSEPTFAWMKEHKDILLTTAQETPVDLNRLPTTGRPFSPANANEKLTTLCVRRFGANPAAPAADNSATLNQQGLLSRYRFPLRKLQRFASVSAAAVKHFYPLFVSEESTLLKNEATDLMLLSLDYLVGAGLGDYEQMERTAKAEQARLLAAEQEKRRVQQAAVAAENAQKARAQRREVVRNELRALADIGRAQISEAQTVLASAEYYVNRNLSPPAHIQQQLDSQHLKMQATIRRANQLKAEWEQLNR